MLNEMIEIVASSGGSEREIDTFLQLWSLADSEEGKLQVIENVKSKYGANKGTAKTVKTTTSAAKAAEEAGVKITEVSPSKGDVVTVDDVKTAEEPSK